MILFPAIDLLGGRAVRLRAGRFEDATVYARRPPDLAAAWAAGGALALHVVDLDAARGAGSNADCVARIRDAAPDLLLQCGGGLRSAEAVEAVLALGARAIVGTLAVRRPDEAADLCRRHGAGIVVAVDAREGRVAVSGWAEGTDLLPLDLARRAASWGAAAVLYTDVSRDGLETGPDLDGTRALAERAGLPVLASGGVSSLDDLRSLARVRPPLEGVVVGRALLEGRFGLEAALAACAG